MSSTESGRQKFLNYMLYGVLRAAKRLGNEKVFMRTIEQEALRKYFGTEGKKPTRTKDALSACESYHRELQGKGIMDAEDTFCRAEGDRVSIEIGPSCPYRDTCAWIDAEQGRVHCFRAVALSEMLRISLRRDYEWSLNSFGVPCRITLEPSLLEAAPLGD